LSQSLYPTSIREYIYVYIYIFVCHSPAQSLYISLSLSLSVPLSLSGERAREREIEREREREGEREREIYIYPPHEGSGNLQQPVGYNASHRPPSFFCRLVMRHLGLWGLHDASPS